MRDTTRRLCTGLLAVLLLLLPQAGQGRTSSGKLGLLWRPASTHPVIRLRGTSFPIQATAPATAKSWDAKLVPPHASWKLIPLKLTQATHDKASKRWTITATIPASAPEELYGLQLSHSTASDTNKIAVRVVKAFPNAYYVAHYTDTQNTAIIAGHTSKMKVIVDELNLIQPAFAINTGDLVTYGNASPQGNNEYKNFINTLEQSRVTTFHIPGNHDIYHMRCWDRKQFQAQYEEYIGERAYSFDFGAEHYTGVELSGYTWMCPHATLTTAQQVWLKADFSAAAKAGKTPLVLFGHQLEYDVKLASSALHKLCSAHGVPLYLYGHIHSDKVDTAGKPPTHYVATDDAGASRFRLVDVASGKIVSYGYAGAATSSVPTGNLSVAWSQPNNGKSKDVTATFKNGLSQALTYLKQTFIVAAPGSATSYQASGGTIYQVVHTASGPTYVYVRGIKVKAKGQTKVRVWLATTPDAGLPDSGAPDAGAPDSGAPDAGITDTSQADGGGLDMPTADGPGADLTPDMSAPDQAAPDSTAPNSGQDSAVPEQGAGDSGSMADAGPGADGKIFGDAAQDQAPAEGCSCDLQGGGRSTGGLTLLLALLCWAWRRRDGQ